MVIEFSSGENRSNHNFVFSIVTSTVGINPKLSDPFTPRTSKLGWRYFEANKIDRNKLQIRTNWQKGTGTKMAEKLNNFEQFERKKKIQPCSQPSTVQNLSSEIQIKLMSICNWVKLMT